MSVVFDCFWWWRAEFGSLDKHAQGRTRSACERTNTPTETVRCAHPGLVGQEMAVEMKAMFLDSESMITASNYFSGYPDWDRAATTQNPTNFIPLGTGCSQA